MTQRRRIRIWATLGFALTFIAAHLRTYILFIALLQGLIVLIVVPQIANLFNRVLVTVDIDALTLDEIGQVLTNVGADLLLIVIIALVALFVLVELGAVLIMAHRHQSNQPVTARLVGHDLLDAVKRLRSPQTLALLPYFFLLLPLGNLGIAAFLLRGIKIPNFISGELTKTDSGRWMYYGILAVIVFLNIRLFLTLSVYLTERRGVLSSMARSWQLTRWQGWRILALIGLVTGLATVLVLGISEVGQQPTVWSDEANPDLSPTVAGVSLAAMRIGIFVVTAFAAVTIAHITAAIHAQLAGPDTLAKTLYARPVETTPVFDRSRLDRPHTPVRGKRLATYAGVGLAAAVAFAGMSYSAATTLTDISDGDTAIIAHRGYISTAVENSIEALEDAAAFHPAYIEIDILETKDGGLVVMHDNNLSRLAGLNRNVSDMTLAEVTTVTIRQNGFTSTIPSFDDFIERAKELDSNLLVELKPHGKETAEFLQTIIDTFDRHGVADDYLVQSLDKDMIEELDGMDDRIQSGYVVPIRFGYVPRTTADFVVVEEFSYTEAFRNEAWAQGLDIMVWTVNERPAMRQYLRDGVNAIITDFPDKANDEAQDIETDTSISSRLSDAIAPLLNL